MKKSSLVLVLRHVLCEHLGYFAELLEEAGFAYRYIDGGAVTDAVLRAAEALIVMGGPMSANDAEPWVETEIRAIQGAVRLDKPVLGICLGAQLLAKALGARVYPNRIKEIGWSQVHLTAAGQADPLFSGIASPIRTFQWHGETFDIPEGAGWLAFTDLCRNQAFRYGRAAYGLQFHPEVTPEMIREWCRQDENCGALREVAAPLDAGAHNQRELANTLFRRWIGLVRNKPIERQPGILFDGEEKG